MLSPRKKIVVVLCSVALGLAACGGGGEAVPVDIHPEEDVCQTCRMLITDQRFAAECVMKKGRAKKFDDPICMIRYFDMAKTLGIAQREDVRAYFVKDYDTKEWMDAQKAHFVKANVVTVMGYGVVSFKSKDRASQFANEYNGTILRFDDMWELYRQANAEKEVTISQGVMKPDVVSVRFGDLVEIRINVDDDREYSVAINGYDNEGVFPVASKGHPAFLRLNAVRPGADFAFIDMKNNQVLGRFRVEGAHFPEELKKR
ncbi:MAG: nitrous oxide reductase accessory protein NosL [Thermodesulfobacteriota bacterium]